MKNSKNGHSLPANENYEQNTSQMETPEHANNGDGELNESNVDNQENRIQDNPFKAF